MHQRQNQIGNHQSKTMGSRCLSWLFGGVFHELVFDGPYVGALKVRCAKLFSRIKAIYEEQDAENMITQLTISNVFQILRASIASPRKLPIRVI